jgi:hypothetical protein
MVLMLSIEVGENIQYSLLYFIFSINSPWLEHHYIKLWFYSDW